MTCYYCYSTEVEFFYIHESRRPWVMSLCGPHGNFFKSAQSINRATVRRISPEEAVVAIAMLE